MSVLRLGSTKKFSDNWDGIFSGGGKKKPSGKAKKASAKTAKKKTPSAKKSAGKKSAKKKR